MHLPVVVIWIQRSPDAVLCRKKKKQSVCSPVEAQGNEKALVNASPSAGHLDPEISRCSVVPGKRKQKRGA